MSLQSSPLKVQIKMPDAKLDSFDDARPTYPAVVVDLTFCEACSGCALLLSDVLRLRLGQEAGQVIIGKCASTGLGSGRILYARPTVGVPGDEVLASPICLEESQLTEVLLPLMKAQEQVV